VYENNNKLSAKEEYFIINCIAYIILNVLSLPAESFLLMRFIRA